MGEGQAVDRLRKTLEKARSGAAGELTDIVAARDDVFARYGTVFSSRGLSGLTPDEFLSFLQFKNNRHWKSIHRQGTQIVADMDGLRSALELLLNESQPIESRLRRLRPKNNEAMVKGLARSVLTPILLIAYPDRYGVVNQIAENAMKDLGIWPSFDRGADFAEKYVAINQILNHLAGELDIDLWTLDALWWGLEDDSVPGPPDPEIEVEGGVQAFGLEVHLHDFLRDNWDHTELGVEWALYEDEGEVVGYKFNTGEVGEIDLLARHRTEARWLVVELKRGRTSDAAVGQALRYRGWVKRHLAADHESVEAIVLGHGADPKMMYALDGLDGVTALTYSVRFTVREPSMPWESDLADN